MRYEKCLKIKEIITDGDKLSVSDSRVGENMTDILIRAGPGTGKTTRIVREIVSLVKDKKVDPSKILCITYTNPAVEELRERLNKNLGTPSRDIEVHTFHSFALNHLELDERSKLMDDSIKRYVVFRSLVKRNVFNYSKEYLREYAAIISGMIEYLRCYNVSISKLLENRSDILSKLYEYLPENSNFPEYERFLDHFINIYKDYEQFKRENNYYDYTDMLEMFIKTHKDSVFDYDYIFVDELQDTNILEAEVVRIAANKYNNKRETQLFLVGDAKQSIFGFQGGSLVNFREFSKNSDKIFLTDNYRSCQKILDYSAAFLEKHSRDEIMINEAKELTAKNDNDGGVYYVLINNDNRNSIIRSIIENTKDKKIGIITRTNTQAEEVSNFLSEINVDHYCSAPRTGSLIVKNGIIDLLESLFWYDNPEMLAKGLVSPFSGVNLVEILNIFSGNHTDVNFDDIKDKPNYKRFVDMVQLIHYKPGEERDPIKNLKTLFEKYILPISVAFGEEGMLSAVKLYNAVIKYYEEINTFDDYDILDYLRLVDVSEQKEHVEKRISVTTVHKAKGLDYDVVIYLPSTPKRSLKLIEYTEHAILSTITPSYNKEEIDEESIRVDYVAFTRAKEKLFLLFPDKKEFKNMYLLGSNLIEKYTPTFDETNRVAINSIQLSYVSLYSEFIRYLETKDLDVLLRAIESFNSSRRDWMKRLISDRLKQGFETISYSSLVLSPVDIFLYKILGISGISSEALELGTRLHRFYHQMYQLGRKPQSDEEKFWYHQWELCVEQLKEIDPNIKQIGGEVPIYLEQKDISEAFGYSPRWIKRITGKIDAIFQGDKMWIVDYKTSKKQNSYNKQLVFYKQVYAKMKNLNEDDVNVAIFYVLLRDMVNDQDGKPIYHTNVRVGKRSKQSMKAIVNKLKCIDEYISNPDKFIEDLSSDLNQHPNSPYRYLILRFIEEYNRSKSF